MTRHTTDEQFLRGRGGQHTLPAPVHFSNGDHHEYHHPDRRAPRRPLLDRLDGFLQCAHLEHQNLALLGTAILAAVAGDPTTHLIWALITFVACIALWSMADGFGGGDAKMLPSVALALGPLFPFFLAATALVGIGLNVYRWALPAVTWRRKTDLIPLGVAAAPGYVVAMIAGGVL